MATAGEEVLMRRALALLLMAITLSACGGDVTSIDPVAQAANKTENVAGARFMLSARIEAEGQTVEFKGPGEIADHGKKMHMRMTLPAAILGMKGLGGKDVTFDAISSGKQFYFRGGPFAQLARKKWVVMRDDDPSFDLGQSDPSKMLEYLRAVSKVDEKGSETVRGVQTTHYVARIQLDKVADKVSPEAARAFEQMSTRLGTDELPVEVWVSDDGLVRKLTMNWHPSQGSFALDMELFGFGDVDIDVPDANETVNFKQLLGGG
jgi:hypothetical protein